MDVGTDDVPPCPCGREDLGACDDCHYEAVGYPGDDEERDPEWLR